MILAPLFLSSFCQALRNPPPPLGAVLRPSVNDCRKFSILLAHAAALAAAIFCEKWCCPQPSRMMSITGRAMFRHFADEGERGQAVLCFFQILEHLQPSQTAVTRRK